MQEQVDETQPETNSSETTEVAADPTAPDVDSPDEAEPTPEDMYPRRIVEELRQENGKYRQRASGYAQRLHVELVRATGRLADPTDLPYDAAHLDDPETLTAAIDALLEAKPHLESRRPVGDIGQGHKGEKTAEFSLMDRLRSL
ncbi:hypothetical protein [Mycobacterium sp. 852002-51961_SCH5331710]|uniref:hypothetical protein n=1 Tax=Mycobacterium sp. 852002-51961_SCH5331710 TaxID=1834105 RepID=UPI000800FA5F|nr:hypothetical protein [Mycobacterium sp. 852002-51961_SCH5331710]OBB42697.1 hypothetical protein A5752_06180 [Mycobacterium sp. 852002-51961_SCH5331710]